MVGQPVPSNNSWPQISNKLLKSIFARVGSRQGEAGPIAFIRPVSLRLDESVMFPTANQERVRSLTDPSPAIALRSALGKLSTELPPEARLEGMLFAFQQHAWCLPSPLEGVSLYDFARMHAALAAASADTPGGEICLVGGDLSGVQEFIYSVTAKGATKQLRGRSLYLQLLTDAYAHFVLQSAGMPLCNLLYAGGGRFYVVLPGLAQTTINEWRRAIGQRLFNAHRGALYLALGGISFTPANYTVGTWEALSHAGAWLSGVAPVSARQTRMRVLVLITALLPNMAGVPSCLRKVASRSTALAIR
jgi:CRISPR-associated protein Csm1